MHLIIVSDAEPTCSIASFPCNRAALSVVYSGQDILCQQSELQLMVEISPKSSLNRITVSGRVDNFKRFCKIL